MIIQGFLDIVIYTKADRPFGIFELVIGTYKNNFYERLDLQSFLTHGDPIQIRHLNIRDNQIYKSVFQDVQSQSIFFSMPSAVRQLSSTIITFFIIFLHLIKFNGNGSAFIQTTFYRYPTISKIRI